ncbi:MAG: hypothetical protein FWD06_08830 [Oscillospiraceae bacterium]|nr:hypothetical protein [Oscillospiraceae bacterium]
MLQSLMMTVGLVLTFPLWFIVVAGVEHSMIAPFHVLWQIITGGMF